MEKVAIFAGFCIQSQRKARWHSRRSRARLGRASDSKHTGSMTQMMMTRSFAAAVGPLAHRILADPSFDADIPLLLVC